MLTANISPPISYKSDFYPNQLTQILSTLFNHDCWVFLVSTGTAANSLSLSTVCPPQGVIYCSAEAHILSSEASSPVFFTGGAKIVGLSSSPSKIDLGKVRTEILRSIENFPHSAKPSCITVTQSTELGLVYSLEELQAVGAVAREFGLFLHMDGARFANAVDFLGCSPAEMSWKIGVDVLSFGVTKNGGMGGEAVVFFNQNLAERFRFLQKRGGQLLSKSWLFSVQWIEYLKDDLWLKLAHHSNIMAKKLAEVISCLPENLGLKVAQEVQTNELFVTMPKVTAEGLREKGVVFGVWNSQKSLFRFVTSWATTDESIAQLSAAAVSIQ
jgi:threonine aldolase